MLNADIVAINQDEGGHPPRLIRQTLKPGTPTDRPPPPTDVLSQVFGRPLGTQPDLAKEGGEVAVVLLNREEEAKEMRVTWEELGLVDASQPLQVYDVIERRKGSAVTGSFAATVGAHDVAFVRLRHA